MKTTQNPPLWATRTTRLSPPSMEEMTGTLEPSQNFTNYSVNKSCDSEPKVKPKILKYPYILIPQQVSRKFTLHLLGFGICEKPLQLVYDKPCETRNLGPRVSQDKFRYNWIGMHCALSTALHIIHYTTAWPLLQR